MRREFWRGNQTEIMWKAVRSWEMNTSITVDLQEGRWEGVEEDEEEEEEREREREREGN
jgi:hypothetical protein